MSNNAKIIILRGNSGSGKTTIAHRLQKQLGRGTLLISQDVIRREMLWANDGADTKALPLLIDLVKYGSQHCEFIILEGILNAKWYKELFEVILSEYGANIFAYYYDLPFEETLQRHQTKPNCNDFGEDAMRRWWNDKDYIGIINEKSLTVGMSIDETVNMIMCDISK